MMLDAATRLASISNASWSIRLRPGRGAATVLVFCAATTYIQAETGELAEQRAQEVLVNDDGHTKSGQINVQLGDFLETYDVGTGLGNLSRASAFAREGSRFRR